MSETHNDAHGNRRDFLYVATAATGTVVTGAIVWPLIDQMNPSADVLALSTVRVDISGVEEGSQISIKWQGKPVFIRHRTQGEIDEARAVSLSDLKDQSAENANLPGADAADENRAFDDEGKFIVMVGVCTHLGCIPLGDAGDYDGWFCPCHGSHYDTSGRIRKGPAPTNLPVPKITRIDDTTIEIG